MRVHFWGVWVRALWFLILLATTVVAHAEAGPVGCYSVFVAETNVSPAQPTGPEHLMRAKDIRLTSDRANTPWADVQIYRYCLRPPQMSSLIELHTGN